MFSTFVFLQLFKALIKKLKLKKEAMQSLANVLIEAQMAYRYQDVHQLPIKIDEKLGATHEVLTLADERTFDKATVENLLAFFKDLPPADLNEVSCAAEHVLSRHAIMKPTPKRRFSAGAMMLCPTAKCSCQCRRFCHLRPGAHISRTSP